MNDDLPITPNLTIPERDISWESMRASGPGGQHVNKSETAVRLRFALATCAVLREAVKARIRKARPSLVTGEGELLVACDTHRSRERNLTEARRRLAGIIKAALREPKPRKATRPTRASKERRLAQKRRRGNRKQLRGKVRGEE